MQYFFLISFWCVEMWTWTRRCLIVSWVGRFMIGDEQWGVSYYDALVWGYERGGSYVPCSHLRATTSEVRRVGLRAGRFIEVGPRVSRYMEAWYILGPWPSNCMGKWINSFICIMRQWSKILGYRLLRLSNLDGIK